MRGAGYDRGVGDGRWMCIGGYQTCDVGHIGEVYRADVVRDLAETLEIDSPRVG